MNNLTDMVARIDVLDQAQISNLKYQHPGKGVGIAVGEILYSMVEDGRVKTLDQLPDEYRNVGKPFLC